jgi:ATP-dependent Zn protease
MTGYDSAKTILSNHMDLLNRIAAELLEKEVLNGPELDDLIGAGTSLNVAEPAPQASA